MLLLGCGLVSLLGLVACGSTDRTATDQPSVDGAVFEVLLPGCEQSVSNRAIATAIGPGLALTVAHSFEDAREANLIALDGFVLATDLVYLDEQRDIALLAFDDETQRVQLEIRNDADEPSDEGRFVVRREDSMTIRAVQLLRRTVITLDGEGSRHGIELGGLIEPGDSGAPVIDDENRMIGMVFSSSRSTETGWAVAGSELTDIADLAGSPMPLTC